MHVSFRVVQSVAQRVDHAVEGDGTNKSAFRDQGFLFPRDDGQPIHPNSFRRRLANAARAAGIPRIVPKDLRSTGKTRLIEAGLPPELVSKWQGHTVKGG